MAAEDSRPSPEQFLNLIRRQEQGRLKVYLGSAAGVGKTFAMLVEGHRLKRQGVDVAIGFVETHGRVETMEKIGDLEMIPTREIEYRGVTLREMDLDAILARRPSVCLVDELAHSNAPGGRHSKRHQDVRGIAPIGYSCHHYGQCSTFGKPLRSRRASDRRQGQGARARLRGRRGRSDRQRRYLRGKPLGTFESGEGLPTRARRAALENFFTASNLTRLRELTLTEVAHLIDRRNRRAEADRAPASATDQVMVGLSSRSPNAQALLRKAARLADRLNAPWYAVYIQTPAEDLTRIEAATQRILGKNLELARELGGVPMTFRGRDVAGTIAAFAREYGIKIIVIGKSRRPWRERLWGLSIVERLLQNLQGVERDDRGRVIRRELHDVR